MNHSVRGVLFALMTGLSWGMVSPVAKELGFLGVDMVTVVFLRAFIVSIALGIWMLLHTHGIAGMKVSLRQFSFFSLSGLLTVVFTGGGFLISLKYLSVPVALILHYTFPLVTMVGSMLILRDKPTLLQILSGALVIFGLWIGVFANYDGSSISVAGIMWGLISIIGLAGQSVLGRYLAVASHNEPADRNVLLFYCLFTGAIMIGLIKFFTVGMGDIPEIFSDGKKLFLLLLQAFFGNLFPYWAYFTSLRYISANTASLICTSEIVVGMAIAAVWFGTIPSLYEMIGAGIIIVAIGVSAKGSSRNETDKSEQYPHEA